MNEIHFNTFAEMKITQHPRYKPHFRMGNAKRIES